MAAGSRPRPRTPQVGPLSLVVPAPWTLPPTASPPTGARAPWAQHRMGVRQVPVLLLFSLFTCPVVRHVHTVSGVALQQCWAGFYTAVYSSTMPVCRPWPLLCVPLSSTGSWWRIQHVRRESVRGPSRCLHCAPSSLNVLWCLAVQCCRGCCHLRRVPVQCCGCINVRCQCRRGALCRIVGRLL